jgi:hypothetical protein
MGRPGQQKVSLIGPLGTAILVFTSQIPDVFGLTLKRYVGPFNIIYVGNKFVFFLLMI